MCQLYYPRCETLNCWRSFDSHFEDEAGSVSLLLLPMKEANTSIMTICNQCPLRLPRVQDLKSLTLHWRSFSGWGREPVSKYFDQTGGRYIQKVQYYTILNLLRLTAGYLHATIYRTTQNAKPEIGPNRSSQTQWNPLVDRYQAGFGLPWSCGSGFGTVLDLNLTVFPVQNRTAGGLPGPVANTNPAACFSRAIVCSEFLSMQRVGSLGGWRSQGPRIIYRIEWPITTMLLIISIFSFLYTML